MSETPDTAALRQREIGGVGRRLTVGVLVLLFAILLPVTVIVTWVHRTVLNTDTYISTTQSIATDPAVTAALSREITDQLYTALNPQAVVADVLPPRAAFLAGPIANGAKGYVENAVDTVLQSDQFKTLWETANRQAHAQLVAVLRGHSDRLEVTNGQVVLNLVPVLNGALQHVQGFASSVVGRPITLPTLTGNELPSAACARISTALGRPLPPTCGQIALFPAAKLVQAQRMVRVFDRGTIALLIITPLLALGALAASRRRRRTLLQLAIGGMLGLVIVRRATMWAEHTLINTGKPENKSARQAILHHGLHGFFMATEWLLIAGLLIAVLALVFGPYRWAVATRRGVTTAGRDGVTLARFATSGESSQASADPRVAWIRGHYDMLRISGVALAILLVLAFNLGFWGVVAILGVLAVYEVGLYRLRPPATVTLPGEESGPPEQRTTSSTETRVR